MPGCCPRRTWWRCRRPGFGFIVGSRPSSAVDDLADHFRRHGNYFTDGQTVEATRTMGIGTQARQRRVVYEYSFKRSQHDNRAINKMIERAEAVAAGTRPLKKDRFVKITDAVKGVEWDLVERARYLAGLKGYVTSTPTPWTASRSWRPTASSTRSNGP